ncbi:MAG TPA: amidase [Burkholderiaceae bacterium]|nr:amidase [Burkholderiaceae bacterium]
MTTRLPVAPDFRTASALVAALRDRQVSAVELLRQAIARIEALDGPLNAVVVRDFERARAAAMAADEALARGDRRALLGIPMTVKEAFNVQGLPTTWGVPGTERIPVLQDAVAVQRLKSAGAIILGKTNVPLQLGDWQTCNAVYGRTNNPWNLALAPGGSSGGAAAALAAGLVPLEFGSDLAGSLRIPAHCCGVYAHKPSFGLVPGRGLAPPGVPVLSTQPDVDFGVVGPMARCAADLGAALDAVAGPDEAQATAYSLVLPAPRHAALRSFRVLVVDEHPLVPTSDDIRAALHAFAGQLAKAGCKVHQDASAVLPDLGVVATTFARMLMSFFGADMPEGEYRGLQAAASKIPSDPADLAANELGGLVLSHRDWVLADRTRAGIAHQWRQLFENYDILLCPVSPVVAFPHDHGDMQARQLIVNGEPVPYKAQSAWSSIASFSGLPATVMPIGLNGERLPIGIQAIGPYLEDRTTIAFAQLVERAFGGFVPPPGFNQ